MAIGGQAIEKLEWYAQRWKIETFHNILKSGCRIEESKLRTNERLFNFIAVCCLLSWRVFWLTMLRRTVPDTSPDTALTAEETALLDRMEKPRSRKPRSLSDYVLQIAKLGGFLARNNDGPPGNIVIWRRLTALLTSCSTFNSAQKVMGIYKPWMTLTISRSMDRYNDVPMSLADGCLVRLSELHPKLPLVTVDADFKVYRRLQQAAHPPPVLGEMSTLKAASTPSTAPIRSAPCDLA